MRILHIDEQSGWRGGEQQASWLLQGQVRRGHEVWIAGKPGGPFLSHDHGGADFHPVPLPMRGEWDLPTANAIARVVRTNEINILHAHTSHAHMFACLARGIARRGKVVVHRRVGFPPRSNPFNRWKYSLPSHFVCVSAMVGRVLREFGIPEERLSVVYSAVDPVRADVAPLSRAELGVPEDAPLLVNAGALVGHKDHANLLAAFVRLRRSLPEARLLIAGEGALRDEIEAKIAALDLGAAVTLLGHRDDAPALIATADVYVSSSWSEGLGTSILEALTCRTPVVAAEAGGAAEMVRPGETGWLVPCRDPVALADAIRESLEDRERAAAMSRRGRALIDAQFTVEPMVSGNLAVYEKLLATGDAS